MAAATSGLRLAVVRASSAIGASLPIGPAGMPAAGCPTGGAGRAGGWMPVTGRPALGLMTVRSCPKAAKGSSLLGSLMRRTDQE
jgi:hypothetical protein